MKVDILGVKYNVVYTNPSKDARLINAYGICDFTTKEILMDNSTVDDPRHMANLAEYNKKVLRHEMVHAFFNESGLEFTSRDETLVDWIAIQFPKMAIAFDKLGVDK